MDESVAPGPLVWNDKDRGAVDLQLFRYMHVFSNGQLQINQKMIVSLTNEQFSIINEFMTN